MIVYEHDGAGHQFCAKNMSENVLKIYNYLKLIYTLKKKMHYDFNIIIFPINYLAIIYFAILLLIVVRSIVFEQLLTR